MKQEFTIDQSKTNITIELDCVVSYEEVKDNAGKMFTIVYLSGGPIFHIDMTYSDFNERVIENDKVNNTLGFGSAN